jgi:hypothetical protein
MSQNNISRILVQGCVIKIKPEDNSRGGNIALHGYIIKVAYITSHLSKICS